jgi:FkbM family methyltransferase
MTHALHEIDTKMLEYINYENGFFIECGANDGWRQSNTLMYERNLNWSGLLIEPIIEMYDVCCSVRPNSIVENFALVSSTYQEKKISGNFHTEGLHSQITSHIPDYYDKLMTDNLRLNRGECAVNCCTLNDLIIKHKIKKVDFFSLDVEGYEIEVLRGLDFNLLRPKYILVETANMEHYQNVVRNYMLEKNYRFIKPLSGNDDLFVDGEINE